MCNVLGASNETDALQNNLMKKNRPSCILFLISYVVELCHKVLQKPFPEPDRRYGIELGRETNKFYPANLPLTILVNYSIHVWAGILVNKTLVDAKERIIDNGEEKSLKVALAC